MLPCFETKPAEWLTRAGFYDRPRHATGFIMTWQQSRTGNALLRRRLMNGVEAVFMPAFGTSGEDLDFFRRIDSLGHKFIWWDEGIVYETVPPHRWKRRLLLRRALYGARRRSGTPRTGSGT